MKTQKRKLGEFQIHYRHCEDFERIWTELFEDGDYQFETTQESPFIIDGGSHIGASILFFKSRFPKARIIGFEPDPENLELLRLNLSANSVENVQIVPKALAAQSGKAKIYREIAGTNPSTWGNSILYNMWGDAEEQKPAEIETTRLIDYIDAEVDFLKLDIEGCEEQVLRDIQPKLNLIRQLEMEFHGTNTSREVNDLDRIVALLEERSFNVEVQMKDVNIICREQTIARVNPKFAQVKAKSKSSI